MASITMESSASAVDGYVGREGASEGWSSLISSAGNNADYTDTRVIMKLTAYSALDQWSAVRRGVFMFDPVSLPTGAVILGGSLSLNPQNTPTDNFLSELVLTNAPVTSPTSLITADFALLHSSPEEYGTARVAVSSISANVRFEFTLNSAALTAFQSLYDSGGVFKLGLMFDWDFESTSPVWVGGSAEDSITITSVSGVANHPILTIEYYVATDYATLEIVGQKASAGDTLTASFLTVEAYT